MSPQLMRFFTLVGIALAAASMQLRARAEAPRGMQAQPVHAIAALAQLPGALRVSHAG
jgi:hypothetical protein